MARYSIEEEADNSLERIMAEQLETMSQLMSQQLEVLGQ